MSILELVGNTPIVEVKGFNTGLCRLFIKLESQNPGGSIKDRIAVSMIKDAEERGILHHGSTIVEATAGNTGIALALIAVQKGYKAILVVPDKMSREKILHLQALGAEVVLTRSDVEKGHPDYYQDKAKQIADRIPGAWFVNQFSNPANPRAHFETTGPEIWKQMNHDVDAVVVGVGSGGTLGGLSKYFGSVSTKTEMVLADPEGSVLTTYVQTGRLPDHCGSWSVEGIGEDFIPDNADFSLIKAAYTISDKESLLTARELLRTNGLFGGSSSGTLLAAALRYCQDQTKPKKVVTFLCDSGAKYLSKMYSDFWMVENGYLDKETHGDLRDLISRSAGTGGLVSVTQSETLRSALTRMKSYDYSQLPVIEDRKIVGIIDESDILFALHKDPRALQKPVKDCMTSKLKILPPTASKTQAIDLLNKGMVAIVADKNVVHGIVTKIDVIDHLRALT